MLILGGPHFAISHFLIIINLFCFMSVLALSKFEMSAKLWTERLLRLRGGGGFRKVIYIVQNLFHQGKGSRSISLNSHYLTIIPRARMESESIALEAEGQMGY